MRDEFSHIRLPIRVPTSEAAPDLEPQGEIRPTHQVIVFRAVDDGVELVHIRCGFVPYFHKGSLKAWRAATFNVKAETARALVSFRETFKRRRCPIAADG